MEINAQMVKGLRERTGAGMMECKSALVEAKGDANEAEIILRKRGIASASKKSTRSTQQGVISSYIHPGAQLGVLVEVNCESDFVARTEDFQTLVHDLAMQIAAADPQFIRREDVTPAAIEKERDIQRARALAEGKPEKMVDKIVEGRLNKFYEEVCLYEQPLAKTRWRVVMASFSFSMRFRSSARSRSTCCGEGVLGWWTRQAGSTQTLTTCPRLPQSITMASAIFSHGFWFAASLVLAPFALGFLISNSTY